MCAEAVNLYGDARDEIVTWDYDSMYIYTQDDAPKDEYIHLSSILIIMLLITAVNTLTVRNGGKIKTIND